MPADSVLARPAGRRHSVWRLLDRVLLCLWLVAVMPAIASDRVRVDLPPSFAAEGDLALLAVTDPAVLQAFEPVASSRPALGEARIGSVASPTPPSGLARIVVQALAAPRAADGALSTTSPAGTRSHFADLVGEALYRAARAAEGPIPSPTREPTRRYTRGGICFDCARPLSLAYPASLDNSYTVRYDDLMVLAADANGANYQRFVTEFDRQVYIYPEQAAGTFVLSVHDGTLPSTGRELESEPLRRMLEGSLHNADSLDLISERLADVLGLKIEISDGTLIAHFAIVQARRMSANDVAEYLDRPMELSRFVEPVVSPETSFLMLICSGRQPDEPQRSFPGRYLLVLQETSGNLAAPGQASADIAN